MSAAPARKVPLGPVDVGIERRADGAILLRSPHRLDAYPARLTERLVHWAREAPDRAFLAHREPGGAWRALSYVETHARVCAIGQALLDRGLSAERPVAILSDNDIEHALLALACMHVGIAYVPESMGIFAGLTVQENLALAARRGPPAEDRLERIFRFFPPMKKFWNLPAGNLSGGQKQMLAISRAIVEPRKLILIDEPTKGLAPAIINNLIEAFAELKKTDTTILMVEQNFHAARSLGDSVAVMDAGRIVHGGRMADLAADAALQTRLLGLSLEAHQ